jgi:hypothetical protein
VYLLLIWPNFNILKELFYCCPSRCSFKTKTFYRNGAAKLVSIFKLPNFFSLFFKKSYEQSPKSCYPPVNQSFKKTLQRMFFFGTAKIIHFSTKTTCTQRFFKHTFFLINPEISSSRQFFSIHGVNQSLYVRKCILTIFAYTLYITYGKAFCLDGLFAGVGLYRRCAKR